MFELMSSVDVAGSLGQVLGVMDTGPGYVATVITLILMWAAGRAFFR
ncbi:MAG: hypothetical protein OJI70_15845 [Zavarzinia sp.]|nr:hypothetical protein [Zavarzinia sp.]